MAKDRIQLSLNPAVLEMLDKLAAANGLNRSAFVSLLVTQTWREDGRTFSELANPIDE